jgi:hypothetical protein
MPSSVWISSTTALALQACGELDCAIREGHQHGVSAVQDVAGGMRIHSGAGLEWHGSAKSGTGSPRRAGPHFAVYARFDCGHVTAVTWTPTCRPSSGSHDGFSMGPIECIGSSRKDDRAVPGGMTLRITGVPKCASRLARPAHEWIAESPRVGCPDNDGQPLRGGRSVCTAILDVAGSEP